MKKKDARKAIVGYLKDHNIHFIYLNENKDRHLVPLDVIDTIYLSANVQKVIGGRIETTLRFREEFLYCQSYFCQPVVHGEDQAIKAARLVAYLNLHYDGGSLYDHNFFLDEEHGDIFNGFLIRYSLLEQDFSESMDHILNFGLQRLKDICVPLVFYLNGRLTYAEATRIATRHRLMGK